MSTPSSALSKNTAGRDFNFYQKKTISESDFQDECDMVITFQTQTVMMLLENTTGVLEYSFNGNTLHGELDATLPSRGLVFDNRVITKIWFRVKSGSDLIIRVEAWAKN